MIAFESLSMPLKSLMITLLLLIMESGISVCLMIEKKQGAVRLALHIALTLSTAAVMLLYAAVIPAERAPAYVSPVAAEFVKIPLAFTLVLAPTALILFVASIAEEIKKHRSAITASSIKESLDHLHMVLCFSYPNGFVLLTNFRMNELSHAIFARPIQNASLFWEALIQVMDKTMAGESV